MNGLGTEIHSEFFSCIHSFSLAFSLSSSSLHWPCLHAQPTVQYCGASQDYIASSTEQNQWPIRDELRDWHPGRTAAKKEVSGKTKQCQADGPMESDCRGAPTAQPANEPSLVVTVEHCLLATLLFLWSLFKYNSLLNPENRFQKSELQKLWLVRFSSTHGFTLLA